ncbi:MAG: aromatic amino acid lyase [Caldithrix sp.]|nr:MAG: aromatic amino acid lyase [Caldithrix sp.]
MSKSPEEIDVVSINEEELSVKKIVAVARYLKRVQVFKGAKRKKVEDVRKYVEENWLGQDSPPLYGFNTGIGSLKNVSISHEKIARFQENYIKSHSVGVGEPLDAEIVRGAILIQANSLSKGHSGIRPVIVDKLIEMLNKRVHPVVPAQGSLGASGDLAPLTHIASVLVGVDEAEIWLTDKKVKLQEIKDSSGVIKFRLDNEDVTFQTIPLQGKEAIALTNATAIMLSIAVHLMHDVDILLKNADVAAALSLEAMMCEKDAFADELHRLRHQEGQINTARNIRSLTQNSRRMAVEARHEFFKTTTETELRKNLDAEDKKNDIETISKYKFEYEFEKNRVQDAYSLRCIPQVHGACKDAFNYVKTIVEHEISAVTDNPLIFPKNDGDGYHVKSGGNFHGEPLAMAMDFLAIAMTEIGSISDRRVFRLLSPRMSFGLTRNLAGGEAGLNSGLMMVQYTGAQLVSENKILAHPASVDSIPTSDNQEDHVSMGQTAARKARRIAKNSRYLIAIEYICALQGIHLSARHSSVDLNKFPLGNGTSAAFNFLNSIKDAKSERPSFQLMDEDEYLKTKIEKMRAVSARGDILRAVEKEVGLVV